MNETTRIADQLRRSYEGPAWHGPSLKEALEGVTPEIAAHRVAPDVHTIAEIVDHVATWAAASRRYLVEHYYVSLTGSDEWPPTSSTVDVAIENLATAQQDLWQYVTTLPDSRLEEVISAQKHYSVYILLHGIVQHNLYHAGQISLLKKLAGQAQ